MKARRIRPYSELDLILLEGSRGRWGPAAALRSQSCAELLDLLGCPPATQAPATEHLRQLFRSATIYEAEGCRARKTKLQGRQGLLPETRARFEALALPLLRGHLACGIPVYQVRLLPAPRREWRLAWSMSCTRRVLFWTAPRREWRLAWSMSSEVQIMIFRHQHGLWLTLGALAVWLQCLQGAWASQARSETASFEGIEYELIVPEKWNKGLLLWFHGFAPDLSTITFKDESSRVRTMAIARTLGYATVQSRHPNPLEEATSFTHRLRGRLVEELGATGKILIGGGHLGVVHGHLMMERYPDDYAGAFLLDGQGMPQFMFSLERNFHTRIVFDHFFPGLPGSAIDSSGFESWGPKDVVALLEKADPVTVERFLKMFSLRDKADAGNWLRMAASMRRGSSPDRNPFDNTNTFYTGSSDDIALNRTIRRYKGNPAARSPSNEWDLRTGRIKAPILALNPTYDLFITIGTRNYYDALTQMANTQHLYVQKWVAFDGLNMPDSVLAEAFGEFERWVNGGPRPEPGEIKIDGR